MSLGPLDAVWSAWEPHCEEVNLAWATLLRWNAALAMPMTTKTSARIAGGGRHVGDVIEVADVFEVVQDELFSTRLVIASVHVLGGDQSGSLITMTSWAKIGHVWETLDTLSLRIQS
eukprot:1477611-Amphidinium_carterae.1